MGPRPGLWVPPSIQKARVKTGLQFVVARSYSEVTGQPRSSAELYEALRRTPLPGAIIALSAINILLEQFTPNSDLEKALSEKFLAAALRLGATPPDAGPQPHFRFFFNRVGVLAALKGVVGVARDTDYKGLYSDQQVGELVLRANDFLSSGRLRQPNEVVEELDLAVECLPTWEIMNPREIGYGLARTYLLIARHLAGQDAVVTKLRRRIGFEIHELRYGGVALDDFIAIVFGIYAHVRNMNPPALLQGVIHSAIEGKTFLATTPFPQEVFESFLSNCGIRLETLRNEITGGKPWDKESCISAIESDEFTSDFLAFRKHPIVDLENGKYLITDIQFVADMLITGLFFEIFNSLPREKREDFLSLWGRAFELYLWELLEDFYPEQAHMLRKDIEFEGGQIDALLDFGTYIVVLEFKFFLLPHEAKFSKDKDSLTEELRLKLVENERGEPKAVRQLAAAIQAIRKGTVETALKRDKPVYPVVVAYEPSVESFGISSFLNSEFQKILEGAGDAAFVKPLTVMSVQELEILLPQMSMGHLNWNEILEARFDGTRVRATSMHQAMYDLMKSKSREFESNRYLVRNFDEIFQAIEARYRAADLGSLKPKGDGT